MKPEHLTAWALDELPPAERAALEDALQENPQALNDAQDTRAFCDLLTRELRDESLALARGAAGASAKRAPGRDEPPSGHTCTTEAVSKLEPTRSRPD